MLLHVQSNVPPAATIWDFLFAWEFEPLILGPLLAMGGLYLVGRRRLAGLSHRGQPGESGRTSFFIAGYVSLLLALVSPIHTFSEELFFVHMVQHVMVMSVAAPLILLANPLQAMIWSLPPRGRLAVGNMLSAEARPLRALRLLTQPIVAWTLFVLNLWVWHQPPGYQAALESETLHYAQHLLFFLSAVLFWWPVIGPAPLRSRLPYPARMLYVFVTWLPNSVLGAGFTFAPRPLMSFYEARPRHWGIDLLADQQLAGLIMWIPGDSIYAAAMIVLLLAALRQEDRREVRSAALS